MAWLDHLCLRLPQPHHHDTTVLTGSSPRNAAFATILTGSPNQYTTLTMSVLWTRGKNKQRVTSCLLPHDIEVCTTRKKCIPWEHEFSLSQSKAWWANIGYKDIMSFRHRLSRGPRESTPHNFNRPHSKHHDDFIALSRETQSVKVCSQVFQMNDRRRHSSVLQAAQCRSETHCYSYHNIMKYATWKIKTRRITP